MTIHYTKGDDSACDWGVQPGDKLTTTITEVTCDRCRSYLIQGGGGRITAKQKRTLLKDFVAVRAQKARVRAIEAEEKQGFQAVLGKTTDEIVRFKIERNAKGRWMHLSAGKGGAMHLHLDLNAVEDMLDKLIGMRRSLLDLPDKDVPLKISIAEFRSAGPELQQQYIDQQPNPYTKEILRAELKEKK